jgi:hypothetical protein
VSIFLGVRNAASGCSIKEQMDFPTMLSREVYCQRKWWALESPVILNGFGMLNKKIILAGGRLWGSSIN